MSIATISFPASCALQNRDGNSPLCLNKKRRFVANFGGCSTSLTLTTQSTRDTPSCGSSPSRFPLQHDVETQLLQVGMRVRKSVNDGYQISPKRSIPTTPTSQKSWSSPNVPNAKRSLDDRDRHEKNDSSTSNSDSDEADDDFWPRTPKSLFGSNLVTKIVPPLPKDCFSMDFDDIQTDDDDAAAASCGKEYGEESFTTRLTGSSCQSRALKSVVNGRMIAKPKSKLSHRRPQSQPEYAVCMQVDEESSILAENWHATVCEDGPDVDEIQHQQPQYSPFRPKGTRWMGHQRQSSINDFGEATFLQRREDVEMEWS